MKETRVLAIGVVVAAALVGGATAVRSTDTPSGVSVRNWTTQTPFGEGRKRTRRPRQPNWPRVEWRKSVAYGSPEAGSLKRAVLLPREGPHHFTWHPIKRRSPNPAWRRWGTDDLVRTVLGVLRDYARAHPRAPRVGIGDLSLERGGYFGAEVGGGIGHGTHQNGLDADIYYPLRSKAERPPEAVEEIDLRLAQDLVDRFVRAGAVTVYIGPNTPLRGPDGIVVPLVYHDNHLHVRISGK